eukprot:6589784-Prorocentrum_lima.AAC.1
MTSSLVGSEMCIRDRLYRWWLPCSGVGVPQLCHRSGLLPWGCHRGATRAVSYTHLTLPTICSV